MDVSKPTHLPGTGTDYYRNVVSEGGKNYRHEHQDLNPVIEHIKFLAEKVNDAPKSGNKNDWRYLGSTTPVIVNYWCHLNGHTYDEWARSKDLKRQQITWQNAEMSKLRLPTKKSSQILMPGKANG